MTSIVYYGRFVLAGDTGIKTPKYLLTAQWGYYPPMDLIKGRDGVPYLYLMPKRKDGASVPPMSLQAPRSLNFTGLKDYFVGGVFSGYAYGEPNTAKTYGKDNRPNPFYDYRGDGYLFIMPKEDAIKVHFEKAGDVVVPKTIELIVLSGGAALIPHYCKQMLMGGFDHDLREIRQQAR